MSKKITQAELKEMISGKLSHLFGVSTKDATNEQYYRVLSTIARDMVRDSRRAFDAKSLEAGQKKVYYLCINSEKSKEEEKRYENTDIEL